MELEPVTISHAWGTAAAVCVAGAAVVGGGFYATMWPSSQWFGRTLVAGGNPGEMALTFDDGPNGDTTRRLLEVLDKHSVKATFFVMGDRVREQPELTREMVAAGHLLGNHTMTHPRLLATGPGRTRREIRECSRVIEEVTGEAVKIFRPPFGGRWPYTMAAARAEGLVPVMWNALGNDWRVKQGAEVAARVMRDVEKNRGEQRASNVLLHDGGHRGLGADRSATVDAVGRILSSQAGKAQFVTVDAWI